MHSGLTLDKWSRDDSFGNKAVSRLHAFMDFLHLEDFYRILTPRVACILGLTDRILLAAIGSVLYTASPESARYRPQLYTL